MREDPSVSGRDRKRKKPGVDSGENNGRKPVHYRNSLWQIEVALSLARFAAYRLTQNVCKLT